MSVNELQSYEQMTRQICRLIPITRLETNAQLAIREIRNQKSVRDAMFTQELIGVNEHLQWISSLRRDSSKLAFALESIAGDILGTISLKDWERFHGTATRPLPTGNGSVSSPGISPTPGQDWRPHTP